MMTIAKVMLRVVAIGIILIVAIKIARAEPAPQDSVDTWQSWARADSEWGDWVVDDTGSSSRGDTRSVWSDSIPPFEGFKWDFKQWAQNCYDGNNWHTKTDTTHNRPRFYMTEGPGYATMTFVIIFKHPKRYKPRNSPNDRVLAELRHIMELNRLTPKRKAG